MSMAAAPYRAQCSKTRLLLGLLASRARGGGNSLGGGSAVEGARAGVIRRRLLGALGSSLLDIGEIGLDGSFEIAIGRSQVLLAL